MRCWLFPVLALLLLPPALAAFDPFAGLQSQLTNPALTWDHPQNKSWAGLPWYAVEQWEIEVCTRGLSTSAGYDPKANNVVDMSLSSPIYMDTITLLAKRTPIGDQAYYEIGWYLQPFEKDRIAKIMLYTYDGRNYTLASGTATPNRAFDGYRAFPVPCDQKLYGSACTGITGNITRARLEWSEDGTTQSLTTLFTE